MRKSTLKWEKHPDGFKYAQYKIGTIIKYNDTKRFAIRYFKTLSDVYLHANSLADAKNKLDKITDEKLSQRGKNQLKKPNIMANTKTTTKAKPKKRTSATSLCRKVIKVPGLNSKGQLLKGWRWENGKPVKAKKQTPKKKASTTKTKSAGLKKPSTKQKAAQDSFKKNSAKARALVASGKAKDLKAAWKMIK